MNGSRGLIIAVAASFIVGCSLGLMGGIVFTHFVGGRFARHHGDQPREYMMRRGPGGPREPRERRMFSYLSQEMDLSPEQRQRMEQLIEHARREHEALRDSMQVQIDRELTPAQRARWKELETEMGMRRRSRGEPPHDRP